MLAHWFALQTTEEGIPGSKLAAITMVTVNTVKSYGNEERTNIFYCNLEVQTGQTKDFAYCVKIRALRYSAILEGLVLLHHSASILDTHYQRNNAIKAL